MTTLCLGLLLAILTVLPASVSDSLAGGWQGTWTKQGDTLPVNVTFEKSEGGYSGFFDSDALQVSHIPFSNISNTNGKVHFVLEGDATTAVFDGTLQGDTIAGALKDDGVEGTFELHRPVLPASSLTARDVSFRNGTVVLAGTLLLPTTPGKHPAILFLQGSGPERRWANRYLAQKFAAAGFVALIYDKRGVGSSTGDWQKVGFEPLADDAVAGIRLLQSMPEVAPEKVGIYGHSQGGTIAPLVATKAGDIGFVIASAASGIAPADLETYSVENSIGVYSLPPKERADAKSYVQALMDVAFRGKAYDSLASYKMRFKSRDWYFDPPPPGDFYWTVSRQMAHYDPLSYWRRVHAPVLLLFGALDERVPSARCTLEIASALATSGNKHVTIKTYSDADHTFTIVDPPRKGGWPKREPDYAVVLTHWAAAF